MFDLRSQATRKWSPGMWSPGTECCADDAWVRATAALPIAFAQVREDPMIDMQLVGLLERPVRVLMVASGGETAALLSTLPLARLHLVDMNEAQLSLSRLKLQLLKTADTAERLQLLGHAPMPIDRRSSELARRLAALGLPVDALGPPKLVARFGPDQCGRYEWLFARLRERLTHQNDAIRRLMILRDPNQQARLVAEGTELGKCIEVAFAESMQLSRLVQIFGTDATANRLQPFATHFVDQTRKALSMMNAADNPFLQSIFLGSFHGPVWPWLNAAKPACCPVTHYTHARMDAVLGSLPDRSYDLIQLSNILDWIKPTDAQCLLNDAFRCLSPGGLVVIRQLNSRLNIPAIPGEFQWRSDLSRRLHATDRSFFYRSLHVGMKP